MLLKRSIEFLCLTIVPFHSISTWPQFVWFGEQIYKLKSRQLSGCSHLLFWDPSLFLCDPACFVLCRCMIQPWSVSFTWTWNIAFNYLSVTMVDGPSPWSMVHHHGRWSITMVDGPSPWSMVHPWWMVHHHGRWSVTMVDGPSPWSMVRHHGRWSITMVDGSSPWSMVRHHGRWSVTMVDGPSPWSMVHHHGRWSITMVDGPSPWSMGNRLHHRTSYGTD